MVPDYQTLMRPVLEISARGETNISDVAHQLALQFALSQDDLAEMIPSGTQTTFNNRIHWAKTYLKQAGLIEPTGRGKFIITDRGRSALVSQNHRIDNKFLRTFDEFRDFQNRGKTPVRQNIIDEEASNATPEERLLASYSDINTTVSNDIIERLRDGSPAFFERAIVSLLLAMGYGVDEYSGSVIGRSGDGGVDGVIDQDPLGVDQIYIQAKRYAAGNNVSAGAIRDFFGSLNIKKAQKGIFVTTSDFSADALKTARDLSSRIVLINGEKLGELMVKHNVGCRDHQTFVVKKIDEDFFE
jgi:restriction system protein